MTATIIILYVAKMSKTIHFQDFDKSIPGKVINNDLCAFFFFFKSRCHACLFSCPVDISFTVAVYGEPRDRTGRN